MATVTQKILKAAVIGCGRIGALTEHKRGDDLPKRYFPTNHCSAIRAVKGLKLIAVCDADITSATTAGKLHGVKNIYSDYKKMIREQSPDIIAIATRTMGRNQIISFAANHGVRALHIEKPLATNLREAETPLKSVKKYGVAISYGTVRRYMPVFNQAKHILESEKFGKLQKITIDISKSQLMWAHSHCIDIINYFSNNQDIDFVRASFVFNKKEVNINKIDMDPVLDFALIKYRNGITGEIIDTGGQDVRILCEKGEIIINISGKYLKTKTIGGETINIEIKSGLSGRCMAIAELRDYINRGNPTSMSVNELLKEQKILLAIGLAGITGKKIKLTDIKKDFTITGKFNNLYP